MAQEELAAQFWFVRGGVFGKLAAVFQVETGFPLNCERPVCTRPLLAPFKTARGLGSADQPHQLFDGQHRDAEHESVRTANPIAPSNAQDEVASGSAPCLTTGDPPDELRKLLEVPAA